MSAKLEMIIGRAGLRVKPALLIRQPAGYKVFSFVKKSDPHNPQTNKFVPALAPLNFAGNPRDLRIIFLF